MQGNLVFNHTTSHASFFASITNTSLEQYFFALLKTTTLIIPLAQVNILYFISFFFNPLQIVSTLNFPTKLNTSFYDLTVTNRFKSENQSHTRLKDFFRLNQNFQFLFHKYNKVESSIFFFYPTETWLRKTLKAWTETLHSAVHSAIQYYLFSLYFMYTVAIEATWGYLKYLKDIKKSI